MEAKETFILRTEWFESIKELDESCQAILFQNLFNYHLGNDQLINLVVKLVYEKINK
jgi:hypothetical protein